MRNARLGGLALLAQEAADDAYREVHRLHEAVPGDSPIERLFCAAMWSLAHRRDRPVDNLLALSAQYELAEAVRDSIAKCTFFSTAYVESQVQIAGWRVDFAISFPDTAAPVGAPLRKLLVECDGHEFHERTKAQAARDRSRDRLAQHQGLPIFRFTGSEIWNDPCGCADEVLSFIAGETRP
ncbi:endonuclease domain-containing protein [Methylobacterium gossipiicola]|uniref:Very-short-patch-repair endonuclease n=1 Tax=Methylobacterium gossipiicola TaxID=582675 RepID=A0A1I2TKM3_9HYPH|nr:DUF559 domain-containing protein [Methylobacterium gossipiicola]SFG65363.1 Very-short-patch-repair endonuclease [Methylobacterium gossipiicola]